MESVSNGEFENATAANADRSNKCKSDDTVDYFDHYGFAVFIKRLTCFQDERCHDYSEQVCSAGVDREWGKVFKKWTHYKNGIGVKLLSLFKKGVPDQIRPKLWRKLLDINLLKNSTQFCYQEQVARLRDYLTSLNVTEYNTERAEQQLCHVETYEMINDGLGDVAGEPSVQNLRQILLDVARTFPTHLLFLGDSVEAIEGRASLFRILAVYARFNPTVGYCQGMSFIAGMLAMVLSEEDSFWCMVALLQKAKYLQGYFDASLSRVQMHAKIFDRLLKQRHCKLWNHLREHNVDPLMYITPWLMCLFTSLPCWDVVLGIWDLIFLDGFTVIFRVALAIMELLEDSFLAETEGHQLIMLLQRPPPARVSRNTLLPAIWKTSVDLWELQTIQAIIDEESELAVKATTSESVCTQAKSKNTLAWKRAHRKIKKNDGPTLLSKIAKMFNAKNQSQKTANIGSSTFVESGLTIVDPADRPLTDINERPRKSSPTNSSTISKSTAENLDRIRRIASGKKRSRRSQSVESLGKGVDLIAKSGASQVQAFGIFSHQLPLRQNQRSRASLLGVGKSPEVELQPIVSPSSSDCTSPKNIANRCCRWSRESNENRYTKSPAADKESEFCVSPRAMPKFNRRNFHLQKRKTKNENQQECRKRLRKNRTFSPPSSEGEETSVADNNPREKLRNK